MYINNFFNYYKMFYNIYINIYMYYNIGNIVTKFFRIYEYLLIKVLKFIVR